MPNIIILLKSFITQEATYFERPCVSIDNKYLFLPSTSTPVGYFIYDISDYNNIIVKYKGDNVDGHGMIRIVVHPTRPIIFVMSYFDFIFSVDISFLYNGVTVPSIYSLSSWIDMNKYEKLDMKISKDGKTLFVTMRFFIIS